VCNVRRRLVDVIHNPVPSQTDPTHQRHRVLLCCLMTLLSTDGVTGDMPTDSADDPDVGGPDDTLSPQESLDSDEVRNDDGDEVVSPPDSWLEPRDDESLDERLASEEPDISVDTPLSDAAYTPDGIPSAEFGLKEADVVDGVIVVDSRVSRGQVDGTPEDGDSFFDVE
jgi:hypothetical protein